MPPRARFGAAIAAGFFTLGTLAACGTVPPTGQVAPGDGSSVVAASATPTLPSPAPSTSSGSESPRSARESTRPTTPKATRPTAPKATPSPRPLASDGRPRVARLSIPALNLENLRVRPHRGTPDDARGTRIQDRGIAASPYGTGGLVGPGGVGNYLITGHRTSSTKPFLRLPRLRNGARVHVEAGGQRYTYRIVDTRRTSFRSTRSLRRQSAAVPGRPGERPTKAMITLSTCRTPEDHAEGNYWSDEFGNPEHRIDKIGELVDIRAASR
jgi:sortase A